MSNAILIKEVNNQPVIFNVDNVIDAARLESLQAVKMAEDLVSSVFGENSQYADNTTCTITDNPNNQEFPYTVVFDSSKIPSKPKRELGAMASTAMPSEKFIEIALSLKPVRSNEYAYHYTAPADGYVHWYIFHPTISTLFHIYINPKDPITGNTDNNLISFLRTAVRTAESTTLCLFLPVTKGSDVCFLASYGTNNMKGSYAFFHYAKGAI